MPIQINPVPSADTLALRTRFREEMSGQIVHDSIHRRAGWTESYRIDVEGSQVGFGSVAVAGSWKDRRTIVEFYMIPAARPRAFAAFEAFLAVSRARDFEAQTNVPVYPVLAQAFGRAIFTEKIVFQDGATTTLPADGAVIRPVTPPEELRVAIERRQGGGEWILEWNGVPVGRGGILFHYNRPYGDVHMEVGEPCRRRGLGSFLVQELKRECHELGAIPAARCSPDNVASRQTLQRAGFAPVASILCGSIGEYGLGDVPAA